MREMRVGIVKWYSKVKSYGFIADETEARAEDVFLHRSGVVEGYVPYEGDRVQFDIGHFNGKTCALNVSPLELAYTPSATAVKPASR